MSGQVAILNNIILSRTGTISLYISNSPQTQADWIIKNNIIDGYAWDDGILPEMTNNIYVDFENRVNCLPVFLFFIHFTRIHHIVSFYRMPQDPVKGVFINAVHII